MLKSLRPCKQIGCPKLVPFGYCEEHRPKEIKIDNREGFKKLDEKKSIEMIRFYSSRPWIKVSRLYRKKHPICERCEKKGKIVPARLVHHKKEVRDILKIKGNPLSYRYLESLCANCHLEELRKRKESK